MSIPKPFQRFSIFRYYPSDDFQLGVPYVLLERDVKGEGKDLVKEKIHLI